MHSRLIHDSIVRHGRQLRQRWRPISIGTLALCQALALYAQTPFAAEIRTVGIVGPEREVLTLRATCFGRTFAFSIVNDRRGPSTLAAASVDGRPARSAEVTANLRRFLADMRNVHFGSTECISRDEVGISLSGLSRTPRPGANDEELRLFRIRFR